MKDRSIFIAVALESIGLIQDYTEGYSLDQFLEDRKTQDAVIRNLEVIGQALKDFGMADLNEIVPEMPWRQISGMRNILAHEYLGVDMVMIWDTLKIHPDPLQTALLFIHESVRENGMNEAIDIDRLIPAWQGLRAEAPIGHIESEGDYQQLTLILDRLLDVVRDDGTHPLYSLVTLIGDLLEAYEANLEPLNNQPLPDAGYNNWHS